MGTPAASILARAAVRHGRRGRADEGDAGGVAGLDEGPVLGEEAVARVDGVGAGAAGGVDDFVDPEVALGGGRGA
jgi:hypothetical protein